MRRPRISAVVGGGLRLARRLPWERLFLAAAGATLLVTALVLFCLSRAETYLERSRLHGQVEIMNVVYFDHPASTLSAPGAPPLGLSRVRGPLSNHEVEVFFEAVSALAMQDRRKSINRLTSVRPQLEIIAENAELPDDLRSQAAILAGLAYEMLQGQASRLEMAERYYRLAVDLDPSNEEAKWNLERVLIKRKIENGMSPLEEYSEGQTPEGSDLLKGRRGIGESGSGY